jgi:hypothetical protein
MYNCWLCNKPLMVDDPNKTVKVSLCNHCKNTFNLERNMMNNGLLKEGI